MEVFTKNGFGVHRFVMGNRKEVNYGVDEKDNG